MKATDPYLEQFHRFEGSEAHKSPSWVFPIRKAGLARFAELGFPTLKDEDWRFTNIAPLTRLPFLPAPNTGSSAIGPHHIQDFVFSSIEASRLVFIDGHFSTELSHILPCGKGVHISSLSQALGPHSRTIEQHLARYSAKDTSCFSALNDAFFQDGAFIHLEKGRVLPQPVHLLYISTHSQNGISTQPRNLILADSQTRLTLLESYVSLAGAPGFTNAVSEFVAGDGAIVEHCKFQDENAASFHLASLYAQLGRDVRFTSHSISSGAKLSRNTLRTTLDGEGIETILNGLYVTHDDQLADHHMIVDHAKPNCASHEYFNGILQDQSRGVFHGRILVRKAAQKTDAKQTNKNLLLSDDATVNTKPQLEIYADDVKCTHGATIGQLNEESIFYLRARGISAHKARRMLVHAFAGEIIDRVQCESAREDLDAWVHQHLETKCNKRRAEEQADQPND